MPKDLGDLALRMDKLAASLKLEASRCAVETALVIHANLTEHTPVDTSLALSNWDIFLGSYTTDSHEAYFEGKRGSTQASSIRFAKSEAKSILESKKPGETIYIVNSVDYIKRLNEGYSAQEPAGFVERAIMVGDRFVKNFKINLG